VEQDAAGARAWLLAEPPGGLPDELQARDETQGEPPVPGALQNEQQERPAWLRDGLLDALPGCWVSFHSDALLHSDGLPVHSAALPVPPTDGLAREQRG